MQGSKAAPGDAAVLRRDNDSYIGLIGGRIDVGVPSRLKRKIKMLPPCLAIFPDGYGSDISARVGRIAGGQAVVLTVADLVLDGVASGVGEEHLPRLPQVAAAPQGSIHSVDYLRVHRIEGECRDPQIGRAHV